MGCGHDDDRWMGVWLWLILGQGGVMVVVEVLWFFIGGLVIWFWDWVCDLVLSLFLFVILVVGD